MTTHRRDKETAAKSDQPEPTRPSDRRGAHITNGAEASNLPPDVDTADLTDEQPSEVIEQAKRDLDAGQVDTDMRSTPGLDADRKKKLLKQRDR